MPRPDALLLRAALLELSQRALGDHRLEAESQRARREFFAAVDATVTATQEQRFLEWFLLEHESLALAAIPAEILPLQGEAEEALLDSTVGVFRVETIVEHGVEARDLQDDEAMQLLAPAGALQVGDLMVGRLYFGGREGWQPSAAVAIYRPGDTIAAAFARDLERLALDRRLSQFELEQLLLRQRPATQLARERTPAREPTPAPIRPIEHLEAALDTILAAGGATGIATEISDALLQADRPGVVMGPLMDQLAFDTNVDLDAARTALTELWNAHHPTEVTATGSDPAGTSAPAAPSTTDVPSGLPGESLGERLVRTLDAGLGKKQDLGELFRQLEAMAGIEPDEDEDDDDALALAESGLERHSAMHGDEATDDGDLAPLVTEFVWETGCGGSATESVLQSWVGLQRNAALPHTDVEQITGQDLMRLLLHIYLHAEPRQRAVAVRSAFTAVESFSAWAEATQELSLQSALGSCRGALLDEVERLQAAGLQLTGPVAATATRPTLLHVEEVGKDGFGVRSDEGSHWIAVPPATAGLLRADDLLLGSLAHDRGCRLCGPVVVLPRDAEALIG